MLRWRRAAIGGGGFAGGDSRLLPGAQGRGEVLQVDGQRRLHLHPLFYGWTGVSGSGRARAVEDVSEGVERGETLEGQEER